MLVPSPPAVITRAGPSGATSSSTAIKNEPVVYLAGQLKRLSSLRLNCSMITTQNARICAPPCCREHEDRRANNRRRVPEKNGEMDLTNFPSSAICSSPHNNAVTQRPLFGMSGIGFEANPDWSPMCWPTGKRHKLVVEGGGQVSWSSCRAVPGPSTTAAAPRLADWDRRTGRWRPGCSPSSGRSGRPER